MLGLIRNVKPLKRLLLQIMLGTALFVLPIHAQTNTTTRETSSPIEQCQLKMGWVLWPPYQYLDKSGQIAGLQAELYKSIASAANCQLTFVQGDWQDIQAGIKDGDIDLMGDATITPTRQSFSYFSKPYRPELLALYVIKAKIKNYPQITFKKLIKNGFRTALIKDNFYGDTVEALRINPVLANRFSYFDHSHESYRALVLGEIDGLFDDPMIHAYISRLLNYDGLFARHQIIVNDEFVSLMFSKKSVPLPIVERFNRAIEKVKQTVDYQQHWNW